MVVLGSKSSMCMSKNGKDTKHTRQIARIIRFVRICEKCKMHKIYCCGGGSEIGRHCYQECW